MKTLIVGTGSLVAGLLIGLAGGSSFGDPAPVSIQGLAPPVTVTAAPEILTKTPESTTVVQRPPVSTKTRIVPQPVLVAEQPAKTTTRTTTAKPTAVAKSQVSYDSCAEVRAAGKAPIKKGQPGYSTKLDRDKDGIACDS
jgi:hypothetical protein